MNKLSLLIAWRYLFGIRGENSLSTMSIICFISIAIGAYALSLVLCISRGFERETHKRLQGIHSQLIMSASGDELDLQQIEPVLTQEFPIIKSWAPQVTKQAIIRSETAEGVGSIIVIRAVDPIKEQEMNSISTKIIEPLNAPLATVLANNQLLIGYKIAQAFNLTVGSQIQILYTPDAPRGHKISLQEKQFTVGGIFKTGIDELDANVLYSSFETIEQLFPDTAPTHITINLTDERLIARVQQQLKERFGIEVYSWKDLYLPLVAAMQLETYAMFLVVALITLVASMNIIAVLFMHIRQKHPDIAMLKANGMSNRSIGAIFVLLALVLSFGGACVGLILSFISGWLLKTYVPIKLPDSYYVDTVPADLDPYIFLLVFCVVMVLSLLASLLPIRAIARLPVAQVLRFEG